VVAVFQGTLDRQVILAAVLPVLAGQSGTTGCQALAVCLRGLTLGELKTGEEKRLMIKEAMLGLLNGVFVGLVAAIGMFVYAKMQHGAQGDQAFLLSLTVFIAMIASCIVSGISGVTIPLVLRKFGFDPATASSIFLTTATDCVSMGTFLGLATWLVPR
ncbi:MAG: magnesium transporter, partial [Verrucomicrobia bacterium]|nr:magnesium transporter [Verrucomicrobiota bacterium]